MYTTMQTERYFVQYWSLLRNQFVKRLCGNAFYNSVMQNFPSNAQLLFDKIIF